MFGSPKDKQVYRVRLSLIEEAFAEEKLICGCRGVKPGSKQYEMLVASFGPNLPVRWALTLHAVGLRQMAEEECRGQLVKATKCSTVPITFKYEKKPLMPPFEPCLIAEQVIGKVAVLKPSGKDAVQYDWAYPVDPPKPILDVDYASLEKKIAASMGIPPKYFEPSFVNTPYQMLQPDKPFPEAPHTAWKENAKKAAKEAAKAYPEIKKALTAFDTETHCNLFAKEATGKSLSALASLYGVPKGPLDFNPKGEYPDGVPEYNPAYDYASTISSGPKLNVETMKKAYESIKEIAKKYPIPVIVPSSPAFKKQEKFDLKLDADGNVMLDADGLPLASLTKKLVFEEEGSLWGPSPLSMPVHFKDNGAIDDQSKADVVDAISHALKGSMKHLNFGLPYTGETKSAIVESMKKSLQSLGSSVKILKATQVHDEIVFDLAVDPFAPADFIPMSFVPEPPKPKVEPLHIVSVKHESNFGGGGDYLDVEFMPPKNILDENGDVQAAVKDALYKQLAEHFKVPPSMVYGPAKFTFTKDEPYWEDHHPVKYMPSPAVAHVKIALKPFVPIDEIPIKFEVKHDDGPEPEDDKDDGTA